MGVGTADTRTAGTVNKAQMIGVGFGRVRLPAICPQTHDIRMDTIVIDREPAKTGEENA